MSNENGEYVFMLNASEWVKHLIEMEEIVERERSERTKKEDGKGQGK